LDGGLDRDRLGVTGEGTKDRTITSVSLSMNTSLRKTSLDGKALAF